VVSHSGVCMQVYVHECLCACVGGWVGGCVGESRESRKGLVLSGNAKQ
jgi:hypothetical protein